MAKKKKSAVRALLLWLLAGLVVYNVVLILIISNGLSKGFKDYVKTEIENQSQIFTGLISETVNSNYGVVGYISDECRKHFEKYGTDADFINELCRNSTNNLGLEQIAVYDSNGKQISLRYYGSDFDSQHIHRALSGTDISDVVFVKDELYALTGKAIKVDGEVVGCIIGMTQVGTNRLVTRVSEYTDCVAIILSGNRRVHSSVKALANTEVSETDSVGLALEGTGNFVETEIEGSPYIGYYFPFNDNEGNPLTTLFMARPTNGVEIVAKNVTLALFISIIIMSCVFILPAGFLFAKKISKPIKFVGHAVKNLSSGDADLTQRILVKGNDEFARLGNDINIFIENLQSVVRDLGEAQHSLAVIGEKLGADSRQAAGATHQIQENINDVRQQSGNQSAAVSNTSAVLNNATEDFKELSRLIGSQADGIAESSAAIEEMMGNILSVTNSVNKMSESFGVLEQSVDEGNTKLRNVDEKVMEISEQSKMLSQANQMISQIASETNLLAMNAAIEAAHAGDAGKGFSVVADEIRKLAETSSQQSKNINAMLRLITSSIKNVVDLSKDSQTSFSSIVEKLETTDTIIQEINGAMNEQNQASRQVLDSLNVMKNQSGLVIEKNDQLATGISAVISDMETVSNISTAINGRMDEMSSDAEDISVSAQSVSELAGKTQENMGVMSDILSKFKA